MEELFEFEAKVLLSKRKGEKYKALLMFKDGYTLNDLFVCDGKIKAGQKVKVKFTSPNITIIP